MSLPKKDTHGLFDSVAPLLFVFIWSTGFIIARYSADYADPLTFLSVRYALAGLVLLIFALLAGARWPTNTTEGIHALVSGVLLHGIYLGGVWWAVRRGLPASLSALLSALQPILTAFLAPMLVKERINPLQWLGIFAGFCGILIVLSPKLLSIDSTRMGDVLWPLAINFIAMISVTAGSLYQKKFIHSGDLRTVTTLQYAGALALTLPIAFLTEPMKIEWNTTMIAVTLWSVLALSIGAIGLLLLLIRRGEVSRSSQLFFLVPPAAAIEAYILFNEQLNLWQILGMGLTVMGVALATRKPKAS